MKLYGKSSALLCALLAVAPAVHSQRLITTIAGTELLFKGDGKPATDAALGRVTGVSVDSQGRAVFADPYYHVVFRVNTNGNIEVVAGNNVRGYSGDGGDARFAALAVPVATAFDGAGNLYIADSGNEVIRRVTPQGVITTYAGTGRAGFSGDGGRATSATLRYPLSLAVDAAGNLYINDAENLRIRRVTAGGTISTFAGNGTRGDAQDGVIATQAPLNEVEGMAVDRQGNLYITEFSGHKVRRIGATDGRITTVAGIGQAAYSGDGGDARRAALFSPGGVAVDSNGNVLIMDTNNARLRRVAADGMITTIAGSGLAGLAGDGGPALRASFRAAFGLAVNAAGSIFVADRDNYRIRRIDAQGNISTVAGNGLLQAWNDNGPATNAPLVEPWDVAIDAGGNLYIADRRSHLVRRVDSSGRIAIIAGNGAGEFSGDNGPATRAGLNLPSALALDRAGNLYISDAGNGIIRRVDTRGTITTVAGNPAADAQELVTGSATATKLVLPAGIALDTAGNLYIAEFGRNRIRRVSNGTIATFGPEMNQPFGLAFDAQDRLYVVEGGAGRVRRLTAQGAATNVATGLREPRSIAIDRNGNAYVSDSFTHQIRVVDPNGTVTVFAGNGNAGFSGDGGPAVNAALNAPFGVAVDGNGVVYVADSLNDRVRAILTSRPTFAPTSENISLSITADGAGEAGTVEVSSSFAGLICQVTTDGQKWLRLLTTTVTLPARIEYRVDPTGLAAGTQRGEIRLSCPSAQVADRAIPVSLQIRAGSGPKLAVEAKSLTVSTTAGTPAVLRQFTLRNSGSGSAVAQVTSQTETGSGWLRAVAPSPVLANEPVNVDVTVDPSRLEAGTYTGSVTVSGATAEERFNVPVIVTVNPSPAKILLPVTALTFNAVSGGGSPLSQSVAVLNGGQGAMSWRADGETLAGANWLRFLNASGTADASTPEGSAAELTVDPASLAPGTYYARVRVSATGAPNSPQTVAIALNVLSPSAAAGAEVRPSAATFSSPQGTSPSAQVIQIANLGSRPLSYTSARSAPWLSIVPASATIAPGEPARLVIQPNIANLPVETHKGSVTLQFDDQTSRKIEVVAIVTPADGLTTSKDGRKEACSTQSLNVQFTGGESPLRARAGQALNLEARILDNCGIDIGTVRGSSVKMSRISTGEPGFDLLNVGAGKWQKSWQPKAAANTTVRSYMTVVVPMPNARFFLDQMPVDVQMTNGNIVPLVEPGSLLNAASFKANAPVAPGMLISVFGAELAENPGAVASSVPLPTELNNTEVRLGDKPLRLLYSSTAQVNAQIPFDLNPNTEHQIVVKRGDTISSPENFTVSTAQPAIFATAQNGVGQGAITNAVSGLLADAAYPVRAGDFISIYCTGLGLVDPAVDAGAAAPTAVLSRTVRPVTVSVGGRPTEVAFSGLAPGFVGLYQVNAVVPTGLTAGNEVPVTIEIDGQVSPPVTIAVR